MNLTIEYFIKCVVTPCRSERLDWPCDSFKMERSGTPRSWTRLTTKHACWHWALHLITWWVSAAFGLLSWPSIHCGCGWLDVSGWLSGSVLYLLYLHTWHPVRMPMAFHVSHSMRHWIILRFSYRIVSHLILKLGKPWDEYIDTCESIVYGAESGVPKTCNIPTPSSHRNTYCFTTKRQTGGCQS